MTSSTKQRKEKNKRKTITQVMIEAEMVEKTRMLKAFLDNPAFKLTNHGYKIDVLKLVSNLTKEQKKTLIQFLLINQQP